MKKYALIILAIVTSASAMAKVTEADVARDTAWLASQNPSVPQSVIDNQWRYYNNPPNEVGQNTTVYQYSVRNGTKRLKPVNGYICTISRAYGYYHRGLKGIDVSVYQSGGYWYLKAASPNSDNLGDATCWNT
ncbi:hypothetical protein C9J12_28655 [Photobacterium frigidiphilum]|uniref:Uncharacterized protein n=1 Tax=Photobacterium frigidiphilum TaxID=264736 RepID=A0A2T3J685_9GAMM|nr:hypothetical protein [Photobacterium frigidiphilum]PSU42835.1 hypothetical protein C9J12_28655 [Photobacterium frigidiphilum]